MEYKKIEELTAVVTGGTPSTSKREYWDDGTIPWLQSGCCQNCDVFSADKYITQEGYDNCSTRMMPPETVMIALTGATAGKVGYLKFEACGNQSITGILPCDSLNQKYLYYYLLSQRDKILSDCIGGAQPHISQGYVKNMIVPVPEMVSQNEIVEHLEKLSSIINMRHDQIDLLDDLIKARFVVLFNNGNYPKIKLGDACKKITDGTHKTPNYIDEGITFISAKNIVNGELDVSDLKNISEEEYQEIQKRCQTEKNDILLSKSGSLGAPVIVRTEEKIGLFESLAVLKYERDRFLPEFLCEQLKTDMIQRQFTTGTKGVAIKHLHLGVIADTDIIEPPVKEQKAFADFVNQVDKSKVAVQKSLEETQLLFDSLMQKYFG